MRNKIIPIFMSMLLIFVIASVNVLSENKSEEIDNKMISTKYHIELDGYFNKAYHLLFFKDPVDNIHSLMMSFIRFNDAYVSINHNEFCNQRSGILFICFYNGIYDHDSDEDTLIMNGDAWYLKILLT